MKPHHFLYSFLTAVALLMVAGLVLGGCFSDKTQDDEPDDGVMPDDEGASNIDDPGYYEDEEMAPERPAGEPEDEPEDEEEPEDE